MGILRQLFSRPRKDLFGFGEELLNHADLLRVAKQASASYQSASPYPHAVIDNFLSPHAVRAIAAEFPARGESAAWLGNEERSQKGNLVQVNKYHISNEERLGPVTQRLLYELKSWRFLRILEILTGIKHLIPDALNIGGGIHMNCNGAMLKIHADFNRHPYWHLDRRLNLLLYLNEDWQDSYGGQLELWDRDMRACAVKLPPIAARCVIFNTSSTSFHGHPDPMTCPENVSRKSVALYYYTNRPPQDGVETHMTLWQDRPEGEP